jgi:predicted PurR-regulated permease PerM
VPVSCKVFPTRLAEMSSQMDNSRLRYPILAFFLFLFVVSILLLGWLMWPFLSLIILAAVVSSAFHPLYQFLMRLRGASPRLASLFTCGVIFFILFLPIIFLVGVLASEANDLYHKALGAVLGGEIRQLLEGSRMLEQINAFLAPFHFQVTGETLNAALTELGKEVGLFLYKQANAIAANTLSFLFNFFMMLLVSFFLLIDGERLVAFIEDLSPLPQRQDHMLVQKFRDMAGAILIGNGICGLIQGVLGGALFALCGLSSPILWGVIMAILAFLPIVGIGVVLVPTSVFLLMKGRIATGIFFLVFYVVVSCGIEYFFKPKLVGSRVRMHTLLVFLAILGGMKLFGILGIIYGPLVVTAFLTLTEIYRVNYQALIAPSGKEL